jgi:hypothetical protein
MKNKEGDEFHAVQRACLHRTRRTYCVDRYAIRGIHPLKAYLQVLSDDG